MTQLSDERQAIETVVLALEGLPHERIAVADIMARVAELIGRPTSPATIDDVIHELNRGRDLLNQLSELPRKAARGRQ